MFTNEYSIKLEKDDNGSLLVTCSDFPEVSTFGDDEADAIERAAHAIEEAIAARIADRQDIPLPTASRSNVKVSLPHQSFLKVVLWHLMKRENVKKAELARRLKMHPPQVDRLVDVRHKSKPEQIDAAFAAMGLQIRGIEVA